MTPARLLTLLAAPARLPAQILALYANAEKGVVVVPRLKKYAWQDSAMTIPAAVGMPVLKTVCPATGVVSTWANVTLQQDAAGLYYFAYNGTTSGGVTATIDFTATDEMMVVAGARKASDAAQGSLVELSASVGNAGAFGMFAPASAAANFSYGSNGSAFSNAVASGFAAPLNAVLTGTSKISTDSCILRVNGVQAATSPTDQGTGNYGNYPAYIGRRAGTSLPFGDRLYFALIRGKLPAAGQLADVEAYANRLTGAY